MPVSSTWACRLSASARSRPCRAPRRVCATGQPCHSHRRAPPVVSSRAKAAALVGPKAARARCAGRSTGPSSDSRPSSQRVSRNGGSVPMSLSLRSRASPRSTPRRKPLVPGDSTSTHVAAVGVVDGHRAVAAVLEAEVAARRLRSRRRDACDVPIPLTRANAGEDQREARPAPPRRRARRAGNVRLHSSYSPLSGGGRRVPRSTAAHRRM